MPGASPDRSIAGAVADVELFVSGDGGVLEILESDAERRRVRLRVDLSGVECPDCVIPPPMLAEMIATQLRDALGDFEIVVEDPRDVAPPAPAHG